MWGREQEPVASVSALAPVERGRKKNNQSIKKIVLCKTPLGISFTIQPFQNQETNVL